MGIEGEWDVMFTTAMGKTGEHWSVETVDGVLRLRGTSPDSPPTDLELTVDGDSFSFEVPVPNMPVKVAIQGQVDEDSLTGSGKLGAMPIGTLEGTRSA